MRRHHAHYDVIVMVNCDSEICPIMRQRIVIEYQLKFQCSSVGSLCFTVFHAQVVFTATQANYHTIAADVGFLARKVPGKDETDVVFISF